jgi:hypothetical protein
MMAYVPVELRRFSWRMTNSREQHCRVNGRIVGKLDAFPGPSFACFVNASGLRWIGQRLRAGHARKLVEDWWLKKWESMDRAVV